MTTAEYGLSKAARSFNSRLDKSKLVEAGFTPLPTWQDTLEVNRLCTDGTPNACSILYAAAYRAARAMGYNRVVTYILDTENGSSLKAAGYTCEGRAGGLEWNGAKAPKQADQYPRQMKTRWVKKKEGLHGS